MPQSCSRGTFEGQSSKFLHAGSNCPLNDINFDGVVGLVIGITHHGAPNTPIGVGLCAYICQKIGYGEGAALASSATRMTPWGVVMRMVLIVRPFLVWLANG
jgi:hypothetical protein